ncbi:MAG TPA: tail fiber domain-containing protein [Thermoanaerobaculia bacterium]|nr:tail fiber domain-containing protein [Thermoanaerobaculia bacterium]
MHRLKVPLVVCVLFLSLVTGVALAGAEVRHQPVATFSTSSSLVQWQVAAAREKVILTISAPDGKVFTKEFATGNPSITLQELGKLAVDGTYTYELRVVPQVPSEVKAKLMDARDANDDEAAAKIMRDAGLDHPLVQTGSFSVVNGAFISAGLTEPPAAPAPVQKSTGTTSSATTAHPPLKAVANDIVQADDVIIQGSLCVGLDCVVNESFGFDTIRLKENNTRIKFNDTSTSAGFPNNNWQLTANDSASGGANKFSIDDITNSKTPFTVTGNAPSNSIFVDSTGRVGFRTATPVLDLHVATGNTPALRLEQNSSGGFTAQTWDIAGNEANFFVRDVTGGSRLPFRIRPGAPTSSIDINASGNVGVGTASPSQKLDVNGTVLVEGGLVDFSTANPTTPTDAGAKLFNQAGVGPSLSGNAIDLRTGATPASRLFVTNAGNVGIGTTSPGSQLVIANGGSTSSINAGATQFTAASSRTFKENIEPVDVPDILKKIEAVPVVTYDFRNNGPKDRLGLIAEDFYQVLGRGDDKHIDGQDVQMALWMAVQKLTAENKALTERLAKLEAALQKVQN